MTRRTFLKAMGAGALATGLGPSLAGADVTSPRPKRRPNVVLIFTDDVGYGDVGIHGCRDIGTPHIDALAAKGLRCTNGYVASSICGPSRAALMTGRCPNRLGITGNHQPLPAGETTLAQVLRSAGYATCLLGKWHLGAQAGQRPTDRGFEEFFGFYGWGRRYITPEGYYTDVLTDRAVRFIEKRRERPSFLYLAYNATHTPMEATQAYLRRVGGIKQEKRRVYAAMLTALDDGVGRVVAAVEKAGLAEDTLIGFVNDNGGKVGTGSSNLPLRGAKYGLYEGGIRVPFLLRWDGRLQAGTKCDQPVCTVDVLPTCAALAGARLPDRALDGRDVSPVLLGNSDPDEHRALFWKAESDRVEKRKPWLVVRRGQWKLHRYRVGAGMATELYDLAADAGERKDLAVSQPKLVAKLTGAMEEWDHGCQG